MGKATLRIGSSEKPGPVIECEDSLEVIYKHLQEQWAAGHWISLVEAPGFRLVVETPRKDDKRVIRLRPTQR